MDLAVASAQAAAESVVQAMETGDFSRRALSVYREKLEKSVLRDMRLYRKLPAFLEHSPRLFRQYPEVLAGIMRDMFHIDGTEACPLWKKVRRRCSGVGFLNVASDMIRGACAL
jgi:electron transfer flavoprotein-quinone oxidoreductase